MSDDAAAGKPAQASLSALDWAVDAVIALGAFGFGLLQMSMAANLMIPDDFIRRLLGIRMITVSGWGMAAVALTCVPLVVRRYMPWIAFITSVLFWAFFEYQMGAASLSLVAPFIALFTVAYLRSRGEAVAAGCIMFAIIAACSLNAATDSLTAIMLAQNLAITAAVTLAGYAMHARSEVVAAAEARADAAERTRESEAQRRVEEERLRIAREMHDITAHSLSAVSIQAAAASALIDSDPPAAKAALADIRMVSKAALAEMRGVVGVLRDGASEAEMQPAQGLDALPSLVEYLARANIDCTLDGQEAPDVEVPAYIGIALFGIAREAVTNIVRHAGASHARIQLVVASDRVMLLVCDDGSGAVTDLVEGHGLEGMRERVKVLGGSFELAQAPEGGLCVSAVIPLGGGGEDV